MKHRSTLILLAGLALVIALAVAQDIESWRGDAVGKATCGPTTRYPFADWWGSVEVGQQVSPFYGSWGNRRGDSGVFTGVRSESDGSTGGTWREIDNLYCGKFSGNFFKTNSSWDSVFCKWKCTAAVAICIPSPVGESGFFWGLKQ